MTEAARSFLTNDFGGVKPGLVSGGLCLCFSILPEGWNLIAPDVVGFTLLCEWGVATAEVDGEIPIVCLLLEDGFCLRWRSTVEILVVVTGVGLEGVTEPVEWAVVWLFFLNIS